MSITSTVKRSHRIVVEHARDTLTIEHDEGNTVLSLTIQTACSGYGPSESGGERASMKLDGVAAKELLAELQRILGPAGASK